jgi:hypothetical protein
MEIKLDQLVPILNEFGPWILILVGFSFLLLMRRIFFQVNADSSPLVRRKPEKPKKWTPLHLRNFLFHDLMPIVISIFVLFAALYVILSKSTYADPQQKWAFGVVGTILGYWLKR